MSPYNKDGNLKSKKTTLANGSESVTEYSENEITTTVDDKKYISRSKSDGLSRKLYDEIVLPTAALYRKFDYCEGVIPQIHKDTGKVVGSPTTNLVSKITFTDEKSLEYEYDSQERITKVIEHENDTVVNETVYTYDAKGQLLTETVNNTTVNTMTYDSYGNVTSKNGVAYTYGDASWKDLLTKVGEQEIVYDAQGNPISYLGHELTWEKGRQLKEYDNLSFKYNANGIRTAKTVGSTTHTYTVDGTKILREFFGGRTIIPMYDNEDEVCGIVYNGNAYYFVKNLQGDVIYITNEAGETVAKYSYDAWGKPTTVFDTSGKNVAYYNPFRYRSYYYDVETGLYYLQSRYYDPEVGRFINGDEPIILCLYQEKVNSNNLYSYCENEPVMNIDFTGYVKINIKWLGASIDVIIWLIPALYAFAKIWKTVSKSASKLVSFGNKLIAVGKQLFKRFDDRLYCAFAKESTYRIVRSIGVLAGIVSIISTVGSLIQYIVDIIDGKWDGYLNTNNIAPKLDLTRDY